MAIEAMEDTARAKKDNYVLVVDGAVGERGGKPVTMAERIIEPVDNSKLMPEPALQSTSRYALEQSD